MKAMPYEIKPDGNGIVEVINSQTKRVVGTHKPPDAETKAKRQVSLLHAVENDPEWEATNA